jgi:hypothetical protein
LFIIEMLDFGLLEDMTTARGMSAIIISISGSEGNFSALEAMPRSKQRCATPR